VRQTAVLITALVFSACTGGGGNREVISTPDAPAAIGPYSQGIRVGNTLYLAGQIALDPATGKLVEGDIEAQTHRVLKNLGAVLKAASFDYSDVVQVQAYLADLNDYKAMNNIYATYFSASKPARAVVEAARIPRDALVEIMMVAVKS
jgi:2-iminobutanoate/2-iminopropanoate deaminase|tara:strand:- start:605 stop:1048 length:444 start_codon:yes stop_codon:yes gene_type:complete